jgi:hypothetical protein
VLATKRGHFTIRFSNWRIYRIFSPARAARGKLNELGVETQAGGVVKIDLRVATVAELSKKIVGYPLESCQPPVHNPAERRAFLRRRRGCEVQ